CLNWTWGAECNKTCACHIINSDYCNTVTGQCLCKPGFQSTNCDLDIDECQQATNSCIYDMQCVNTVGSYLCK
ncbi:unnamed protein product, partial [Lymnaea stagnalis]